MPVGWNGPFASPMRETEKKAKKCDARVFFAEEADVVQLRQALQRAEVRDGRAVREVEGPQLPALAQGGSAAQMRGVIVRRRTASHERMGPTSRNSGVRPRLGGRGRGARLSVGRQPSIANRKSSVLNGKSVPKVQTGVNNLNRRQFVRSAAFRRYQGISGARRPVGATTDDGRGSSYYWSELLTQDTRGKGTRQ